MDDRGTKGFLVPPPADHRADALPYLGISPAAKARAEELESQVRRIELMGVVDPCPLTVRPDMAQDGPDLCLCQCDTLGCPVHGEFSDHGRGRTRWTPLTVGLLGYSIAVVIATLLLA